MSASVPKAARRDASGYRTHRLTTGATMQHIPVFHVVNAKVRGYVSLCGRLLVEATEEDAASVGADGRCQRPGCKQGWPRGGVSPSGKERP